MYKVSTLRKRPSLVNRILLGEKKVSVLVVTEEDERVLKELGIYDKVKVVVEL